MNEIEHYYDEIYDEWNRLDEHCFEFAITKRYMDEYIPPQAKILDVGGGPGRYALYLSQRGHQVGLLDLSIRNIDVATRKQKELKIPLLFCEKGNALNLQAYDDEQFDVVLLMGPLYHLIEEQDRMQCMREALRVLKPNGLIFVSFISDYAPIQDCVRAAHFFDESIEDLLAYLHEGKNKQAFTSAYFSSSEEAQSLMTVFGLEQLVFAGVENILGSKENQLRTLDEVEKAKWMELSYQLSQDKKLFGSSEHYLYIGRKNNC